MIIYHFYEVSESNIRINLMIRYLETRLFLSS